ncbi:hypothetical protein UFOVP244_60 [uncultured Caudovirales phage]|uniref:Uncharacterized protein n=1 Tax=uncultured Caudovirales phage TaxID=2100421 RepID=A0A6J7WW80_9CAUD|nr:hypothetical protein UFOVP244_60 [uncultured Caudovirales phage]
MLQTSNVDAAAENSGGQNDSFRMEERIIGGQKVSVKVYGYKKPADDDDRSVVESVYSDRVRKLFYVE